LCAPIELVDPIRKQLFKIAKVGPLLPGIAWCLIRPARAADTLLADQTGSPSRSWIEKGLICRVDFTFGSAL
jgi:hypothetical protein